LLTILIKNFVKTKVGRNFLSKLYFNKKNFEKNSYNSNQKNIAILESENKFSHFKKYFKKGLDHLAQNYLKYNILSNMGKIQIDKD
jgi:hypothetical protein